MQTQHEVTVPDHPRCPHCQSTRVLEASWDWNGEYEDGTIRPYQVVWECLDCMSYFTTREILKE